MNTLKIRVAKYWNKIPDDIKLSADVDKFKIKLERYKKERFEVKGNYWELSDGIFDRINDENRQSYVDFMIKSYHSKTKVCECKCIIAVTVYNKYTFQNKYIEYKLLNGNL